MEGSASRLGEMDSNRMRMVNNFVQNFEDTKAMMQCAEGSLWMGNHAIYSGGKL